MVARMKTTSMSIKPVDIEQHLPEAVVEDVLRLR